MPTAKPSAMVFRYWLGRIYPALIVVAVAWSAINSGALAERIPHDAAGRTNLARGAAAIVVLTFVTHVVLHLLISIIANLRISPVEIGVGRVIRRYAFGWGILIVRRYPVRLRFGYMPQRSVADSRVRMALPHAAPPFLYLSIIAANEVAPGLADRLDPRLRVVLTASSILGLLALCVGLRCETVVGSSIGTLITLGRVSAADLEDRYRPYTDNRVWSAYSRLLGAAMAGDRELVRRRYEALLSLNPPDPMPAIGAFHVASVEGDFITAGRIALQARRRDGSSRFADALPSLVLAAKEARQPMDTDVIEEARRVAAQYSGSATAFAMSMRANMCAHDGDVDAAIAWAEAGLRVETDPEVRGEHMLVLAESYAARGRAQEAQSMLARARRTDPHSPRLPHVTRIVDEHLAQGRVALSL